MNNNLILPNFSPIKILTMASIVGLLLISYLTYLSLQQPWLGIHIQYQPGQFGLKVDNVFKNSPAENIISPGDEIIAFKVNDKTIQVDPFLNVQEPAFLPTYKEHNQFIQSQNEINTILYNSTIALVLKNKTVVISPRTSRPLSSMPFKSYWLIIIFGFSAFIIGLNIWSFRRGVIISRILVIAGTGLFIGAIFNAVTLSREIALAGDLFFIISSISHFGIIFFAFSTITILWNYPNRISDFPATTIVYFASLLIWINQTWQITLMPFHAYYFHFLIDFIFLAALAIRQWHSARESALNQEALQWLLVTLLLSLGLTIVLFYIPTIYSAQPVLPISATYFSALLLFLGLAMGVIKYRLFNLPSVWMEIWVWLVAGILLLFIDLALVYLLHLTSGFAFILSAIIVGWIYFPAREWVSVNILKLKPKSIELYFPFLIEQLISADSGKSFEKKWNDILQNVFLPLDIKIINESQNKIKTSNNGINLHVPALNNESTILLEYKDSGNKLYNNNDVTLCQSLYELTLYTKNIKAEYEEGINDERKRIARDLHDDIAAQLLTLIHRSKDDKTIEKSRAILKVLRQTIYTLDTDTSINLNNVLENIYQSYNVKSGLSGIKFSYESTFFADEILVTPRLQINLQYCLDEIFSNITNNNDVTQVSLFISIKNAFLHIEVCDDSKSGNVNDRQKGEAFDKISTRIHEINGKVSWYQNTDLGDTGNRHRCCINLQIPL